LFSLHKLPLSSVFWVFYFLGFDLSLFEFQREHGYGKGNLREELGFVVKAEKGN